MDTILQRPQLRYIRSPSLKCLLVFHSLSCMHCTAASLLIMRKYYNRTETETASSLLLKALKRYTMEALASLTPVFMLQRHQIFYYFAPPRMLTSQKINNIEEKRQKRLWEKPSIYEEGPHTQQCLRIVKKKSCLRQPYLPYKL